MTPLPRELWIQILKIKSQTAWKDQLNHLHKTLGPVLNHSLTILFMANQNTTVYIIKHRALEFSIEESPEQILIIRCINRKRLPLYYPTEYIYPTPLYYPT